MMIASLYGRLGETRGRRRSWEEQASRSEGVFNDIAAEVAAVCASVEDDLMKRLWLYLLYRGNV